MVDKLKPMKYELEEEENERFVTEDELLQAGRAIYDKLKESLEKDIQVAASAMVKSLESGFESRVSWLNKSYSDRLEGYGVRVEDMGGEIRSKVLHIEEVLGSFGQKDQPATIDEAGVAFHVSRILGDRFEKQLAAIAKDCGERLEAGEKRHAEEMARVREDHSIQAKRFHAELEIKLAELRDAQDKGFDVLRNILVSLPVPQVTIPDKAIVLQQTIKQLPSIVNIEQRPAEVVFPEKALLVNVAAKAVLEKPERRVKTEKSIIYGADGRPEKIVEETTES